jgi:Cu-processing system permease protein
MTSDLITIARLEMMAVARLKWIRLLASAFALLTAASAYSAGAVDGLAGADGFARTTLTLVPAVLILVPLAALILGVSGQAADAGGQPFLFGQPVSRATIVIGRWLGESIGLGGAVGAGLAAGGVVVLFGSGLDGAGGFVMFGVGACALAMGFLSLAAAIASATDKRVTALGAATFAWFFFVLFYDGAVLSLAGWLTGSAGGRVLFLSVFGNPTDLVRLMTLSWAGGPNLLGAAGDAWTRFLGGPAAAAAAAACAATLWVLLPLAVGVRLMNRRDL